MLFPHIPRRSVATCVVKALAARGILRSYTYTGKLYIPQHPIKICDAVNKEKE